MAALNKAEAMTMLTKYVFSAAIFLLMCWAYFSAPLAWGQTGASHAPYAAKALSAKSSVVRHAGAKPPNIIFLIADDWGYSDLGAFGSEIETPHLDDLAYRGVRFANFHVAGSCAPTRAMLNSGVMNHRNGLGNMPETIPDEHVGKAGYDTVLNFNVVTLAEMLKAAGYRTYLTGKWHLGNDAKRLAHARGFDRAYALGDAGADNFEQKPITGMGRHAEWSENGQPVMLPEDYYSSTFVVDQMIAYIEDRGAADQPFFASINFLANHIPIQAPDADLARYRGQYEQGWDALRRERARRSVALGLMPADLRFIRMDTTKDWASLSDKERRRAVGEMQAYAAMATAMDREVGRLIKYLKSIGEYENSIIIFLSDNGAEPIDPHGALRNRIVLGMQVDRKIEHIGQRGTMDAIGPSWASAASSPLRGYKFSATEGGLRVPMFVHWAGQSRVVPQGRIVHGFAHVIDVIPTLAELAGFALPQGQWAGRKVEPLTGHSLAPMMTGAVENVRGDAPLGYELSGNAALFRGDYKLVRNLPPTGDGQWRLYDIRRDPGEVEDLSKQEPKLYAAMLADYRDYAAKNGVLDMPAGYRSDEQIMRYAERRNGPLVQMIIGGLIMLGLAAALIIWWLWRRRRRGASGVN